jgi:transcriptional regulator with XRE-family HTH domain
MQELRRARKLTQVRVAKALGVTQDSVSRLEKRVWFRAGRFETPDPLRGRYLFPQFLLNIR